MGVSENTLFFNGGKGGRFQAIILLFAEGRDTKTESNEVFEPRAIRGFMRRKTGEFIFMFFDE